MQGQAKANRRTWWRERTLLRAALLSFVLGVAIYQLIRHGLKVSVVSEFINALGINTSLLKGALTITCILPTLFFTIIVRDFRLILYTLASILLMVVYAVIHAIGHWGFTWQLFWGTGLAWMTIAFVFRILKLNTVNELRLLNHLSAGTAGQHSEAFIARFLEAILKVLPFSRASIQELAEAPDETTDLLYQFAGLPETEQLAEALVVPLKRSDDTLLGSLRLESERPVKLSPLHLATLDAFASRAAAEVARKQSDRRHRNLQERMMQVQKLESVGLLAGGIAHDLNNVLAAAHNHLRLAEDAAPPASEQREDLQQINVALKRAELLCDRLLAYAGRTERQNTIFDINKLVTETIGLLESSSARMIQVQLSQELLPVRGDLAQLSQVVLNLITNAIDAVQESEGTIFIRTSVDRADENVHKICLEIHDSGTGIDAAHLTKIFDPFFTTKGKGRGLGLSAVAGIVKDHEGQIDVQSSPAGTMFSVRLPLNEAPPPEAAAEQTGTATVALRILLVEDDDMVRRSTKRILERAGAEVFEALDMDSAVTAYIEEGGKFDTYLVDYNLGDNRGTDVITRLRELGATGKMTLMSGGGDARTEEVEEVQFLPKPFVGSKLLEIVQRERTITESP